MPPGLPLFLVAALGLSFWGPLNLPDGPDLAGGSTAEVSGSQLLVWRIARAAMLVATAAMGAAAFLGGWLGPWLPAPVWMVLKTLALLALLIGAGHLSARVRPERFVVISWVVLIPVALANVLLAAGVALIQGRGAP
jgi:NADH-quinone oxidoreductase subunit H